MGDSNPHDPLTVVAGDPPVLVTYGTDRGCSETTCVDIPKVDAVKCTLNAEQPTVRTTFAQSDPPNGTDVLEDVEGKLRITEVKDCVEPGGVQWTVRAGDAVLGQGEITDPRHIADPLAPRSLPPATTEITFVLTSRTPHAPSPSPG